MVVVVVVLRFLMGDLEVLAAGELDPIGGEGATLSITWVVVVVAVSWVTASFPAVPVAQVSWS